MFLKIWPDYRTWKFWLPFMEGSEAGLGSGYLPVFPHLTNPHPGNGRGQVCPWWSQFQFHPQHCFKKYFFFCVFQLLLPSSGYLYLSKLCHSFPSEPSYFQDFIQRRETHFTKISNFLGWVLKTRSQQSWLGIADWDETLGFWVSYLAHIDNNWFMMASSSDRQRLRCIFGSHGLLAVYR